MKVVFHERFKEVYTNDPAAQAGRMEAVLDALGPRAELLTPQPASQEAIQRCHSAKQLDWVRRRELYEIAALAAGGAIEAARIGLAEPCFGLIRPPGHHASRDSCWGFCYFNNLAIALADLKAQGQIESALVLDIDLHFGDGTVNILGERDWVEICNLEGRDRQACRKEAASALANCRADMIAISAGFDLHQEDWGGVLATEDYHEIGWLARSAARRNQGGLFAVLEGGYNHDVLGQNVSALMTGMEEG